MILKLKTEKFSRYIKEIKSKTANNDLEKSLISFAFPIESINFSSVLLNLQNSSNTFFFWKKPDENQTGLAIDTLLQFTEYGSERTQLSHSKIEAWKATYQNNFSEFDLDTIPLLFGGMKFSPEGNSDISIWNDFADSDWFIPKILLIQKENKIFVVFNFIYETNSEELSLSAYQEYINELRSIQNDYSIRSEKEYIKFSNLKNETERTDWLQKVNTALNEIAEGDYSKIVLSRRVELTLSNQPDLYEKLESLAKDYPRCYVFAYRKNNSIFFGASPEKLAKIKDGWVEADALAGSTQRGKTQREDDQLAIELLSSKKNLSEQNAVVEFITNSFSGFAEEILYEEKPIIRKLSNIQHLWTPIKAKLKPGHTIFSILKDIHPTPAICGVPWSGALDFIKTTEVYNRGLYAGIVGWFNFDEQGEFAVSIRSGLLKNNKLYAFAGCGIVKGSDPEAEFEEAELKLKPILSLFNNEKIH